MIVEQAITRPGRVLEIGCATGNIASVFRNFEYTGIDTEKTSIELARWKFRDAPNLTFIAGDLFAQSFAQGSFDYVVISHTAHHLNDEYFKKIINQCFALLSEGGKLVIVDMIRPDPEDLPGKRFYYRLDRGRFLRTQSEFESILKDSFEFKRIASRVFQCRKLGVQIIDQILVEACK